MCYDEEVYQSQIADRVMGFVLRVAEPKQSYGKSRLA